MKYINKHEFFLSFKTNTEIVNEKVALINENYKVLIKKYE